MEEIKWQKKDYDTWEDAFRGLVPILRQQSLRIATYTQAIYVQACKDSFAKHSPEMKGQYSDLSYKCGLYHQLGKALVPPHYQIMAKDFTEEEIEVYKKYTTDGRALVASLQELTEPEEEKNKQIKVTQNGEVITDRVPWLMVRESCESHMEHWDGTGYPKGLKEEEIPPIAQIVGLARELDRLSAETKSEDPFGLAYDEIMAKEGTYWNPELLKVLRNAKKKCREIFQRYIHYTMAVPTTIPLIDKTKDRPMGLKYRPMISNLEGNIVAYEAHGWFAGVANNPDAKEPLEDVQDILKRTGIIHDVCEYFLYEVTDTLYRIQNCKIDLLGIVLKLPEDYFLLGTQLTFFNQLFNDQPVDRSKLLLTVPSKTVAGTNKQNKEIIARYIKNGVEVVLDDFIPGDLTIEEIRAIGFKYIRFDASLNNRTETANRMYDFKKEGISILGSGADTPEVINWLVSNDVLAMSGLMAGTEVSEEDLIRDCLERERL